MTDDDRPRLWVHVRNNIERDRPRSRGKLLDRSVFVHHVPRLMLLCRLFGHRPVVDGTKSEGSSGRGPARWVACDRCDTRPYPQGSLDPAVFHRGDPYRGDFSGHPGVAAVLPGGWQAPGPWPEYVTGNISGQLVIGGRDGTGALARVAVGAAGSEDNLSGHVHISGVGGIYWGLERHAAGLQRRLIPDSYDDRECTVRLMDGRLSWSLWGRDGHWSASDPWWMHGSLLLNPADAVLGPRLYSYDDVDEPRTVTVRMPHGDDHQATVKLQRVYRGRPRGRRRFLGWTADWSVDGGIPTKPHGGFVWGSAVAITAAAAEAGTWPDEAAAAIAAQLTRDRASYGYSTAVPA